MRVVKRPKVPADYLDDYTLVPLDKRRPRWPKAQKNVIDGTYYRVKKEKPDTMVCMVTVMPDGLHVAWDNCCKCHRRITQCQCVDGFYHDSSIGFIRATKDEPDWPTRRVMDYAKYHDPFMRSEKKQSRDTDTYGYTPPPTPPPAKRRATKSMTAEEIEALSLDEVQKEADKDAAKTTRSVRSAIKKKGKR